MATDLYTELRAITAALDDAGLEYAIAGAFALAIHGVPRATSDIDLMVREQDLDAIFEAVGKIGYSHRALPMAFSDGMRLQRISRLAPDAPVTLDLIMVDANLEPVWDSRVLVETELGGLWVISREALIRMKLAAGRAQDVADVQRLQEMDR